MFEISIKHLSDIDLNKLAKFTYEVLQASPLKNENRTAAGIEQSLNERADNKNEIILLAFNKDSHEILGKLSAFTGFPEMVFISRWDPITTPTENKETIMHLLIKKCKEYTKDIGYNRLEACLNPIRVDLEKIREEYQILYEKEGFHKVTEEAIMKVDMRKWAPPSKIPELPNEYKYEEIGKRTSEETHEAFYETFKLGNDRLHLDMTPSEQRTTVNYWLSEMAPLSLYLTKKGRIVGFCIGRMKGDTISLGPIGLLPEHRGKGLAQSLLYEEMLRIQNDKDIKYAELEVDVDNTSAVKLYTRFGFLCQYTQEYYSWYALR